MRINSKLFGFKYVVALLFISINPYISYASTTVIWPINPIINSQNRASALWVENKGGTPSTLQVNILAWDQQEEKDVYAAQNQVIASPPVFTIPAGGKQLVRLTRTIPAPLSGEIPYRIIIDEIPTQESLSAAGAGLSFRMRYSVPLFIKGPDLSEAEKLPQDKRPKPILESRIAQENGRGYLIIHNTGIVTARISEANFMGPNGINSSIASGLLGYVLPNKTMRWPLEKGMITSSQIKANLNGVGALLDLIQSE